MKSTIHYALFLAATAIISTILMFLVNDLTQPVIIDKQIKIIEENIGLIYSAEDGYQRNPNQVKNKYKEIDYSGIKEVYEVLDSNGDVYSHIYNVEVDGKNDVIGLLIAVSDGVIDRVVYYKHAETKNLGEVYTREEESSKFIGMALVNSQVDMIAGASTTGRAVDLALDIVENHYNKEGVGN
jgi:Na+-translocating ferredoxin:NAD+ oxidoreductase RnfG subunit